MNKKNELIAKLAQLRSIEKSYWLQKSRIRWVKENDQNISFVHKIATGRHHANFISLSMVPFPENAEMNDMLIHVHHIFSHRFKKGNDVHISDWSVDLITSY